MPLQRGGWIMDIFFAGGIGNTSKSIKRCPNGIDLIRMKALGHLGINFHAEYYGDTMTWREFASIGLKYGVNTTVLYSSLMPNWTYYYDAVSMKFTVTDASGNKTVRTIHTLSDMGVVWEILSSHQFKIYFSANFINDAFLIAWIKRRNQDFDPNDPNTWKDDTSVYPPILLAYVDQFFTETLHWRCNRMKYKEFNQPELKNMIEPLLQEPTKVEILRSNVPVRSATGDYRQMALYSPDEKFALATKKRNAIIDIVLADFLMIAFFASIMNMSKPVFESWMLFELWKWLGSGDPTESIERIFDLSPRW